jgi:hypothetical protein
MSATLQSPAEGKSTVNILLFLITLPRTSKSQKIFKITISVGQSQKKTE